MSDNNPRTRLIPIVGADVDTIQHVFLWIILNHIKDIPERERDTIRRIQKELVEKYYAD